MLICGLDSIPLEFHRGLCFAKRHAFSATDNGLS